MNRFLSAVALSCCLLSTTAVSKSKCDVELGHGLIITDNEIRIVDNGQTRIQINNDNQLFILGRWIELDQAGELVVAEYANGIRETVPELVNLATDGVNLGLSAIEQVVEGMSDKEPEVLKTQLQYVERALMDKFNEVTIFSLLHRSPYQKSMTLPKRSAKRSIPLCMARWAPF